MFSYLKNKLFGNKDSLFMLILALFNKNTPKQTKGLLLLAFIYLVLPLDFIPDGFLGAGLIDDFIIVPSLMTLASKLIPKNVQREIEEKGKRISKFVPYIAFLVVLIFAVWMGIIFFLLYKLFS